MAVRPTTLVELLSTQAEQFCDKIAFRWLADDGDVAETITYGHLGKRAGAIARALMERDAATQRIALIHDSAFGFVPAFFGCLQAGAVAVPLPAPRSRHTLPRVLSILDDAEPLLVLSESATATRVQPLIAESRPELTWLLADVIPADLEDQQDTHLPPIGPETLACLQYTSGSTRTPVGVMLRHNNFLANLAVIHDCLGTDEHAENVCWLPHFHDMGLVGSLLGAVECGATTTLMSPAAFLQRPIRWLEAISRFRGTHSVGPNFAYDLCTKQVSDVDLARLDLSTWRVACNGAEPVQARTLRLFAERFARCGFRPDALLPCYGLAEATLLVAGKPHTTFPVILTESALRASTVSRQRELVSSGQIVADHDVVIVHPETAEPIAGEDEGEILVTGPSVAAGYWGRENETRDTFISRKCQDVAERRYLKTGDLGRIVDGELFVTGRKKDLLIIRGQNHYPQDIEAIVAASHQALDPHWGAAISVDIAGDEKLVIVHELNRTLRNHPPEPIVSAIRAQVGAQCDVAVWSVALLRPGQLPRTSSGKVQRQQTRAAYLSGDLEPIYLWADDDAQSSSREAGETEFGADHLNSAAEIKDWITTAIAARLGQRPGDIDPAMEFAHFGLGSMALVEMAGELEEFLGRDLPPTLLYEHPTPESLSKHLARGQSAESLDDAPTSETGRAASEPMAIVGIGCRFPGASNPGEFWSLLASGVDAIRTRPHRMPGELPTSHADQAPPTWGGYLDRVDEFDAEFFQIAPREAECLDPQQRLMLEVTWETLEDAGIPPSSLRQSQVGVFIGVSNNDFRGISERYDNSRDLHACTGVALSLTANRLSYFFDWTGPSEAIDTACSSSLVAVHAACRSLADGECHLAVAGGVNLLLDDRVTAAFARASFLAPDGRCKAFDERADGYVRGEGAGIVLLKPLSAATADGDRIYALVQGTAVNQDGRSNGLTAPNPRSQQAVIRAACRQAGVSPSTLQYVETHGTGTALGDPMEARALGELIGETWQGKASCLIGSVKSNIGHLESAAGVSGLIKTALMLHHGAFVPSLHFEKPNPLIPFDELPLRVAVEAKDWPQENGRRIAGVSSFGFGGTNAHVVLTSAPPAPTRVLDDVATSERASILPLSAASAASLKSLVSAYIEFIRTSVVSEVDWQAVCRAAATNRDHHRLRLAVLADSRETALAKLESANIRSAIRSNCDEQTTEVTDGPAPIEELCRRYEAGEQIDWGAHYGRRGRVVPLPFYPWNRQRYWPGGSDARETAKRSTAMIESTPDWDGGVTTPQPARKADVPTPSRKVSPPSDTASIIACLQSRAASVLGYESENLDVDRPLLELGMDSLMAVELVNDVQSGFGVRISFDQLLAGTTLADVANLISDKLPESANPSAPASETSPDCPGPLDDTAVPSAHSITQAESAADGPLLPPAPLSPSQERLWLLAELGGSQVLNIPVGVRLHGELDVNALERSLTELVRRHEMLRTTFHGEDDTILQVPQPPDPVQLHVIHLSPMAIEERRREAVRLMEEIAARPFDLSSGPVFRALLLRVAPTEHWLGLVVSHLVADGASMAIFIQELATLYRQALSGDPVHLPPVGASFLEVARRQRERLATEDAQQIIGHWRKQLEGMPTTLDLPTDAVRPAVMTHVGRRRYFSLATSTSDRLKTFSRERGVTPFMTLLAAFQTLLGRCSSQDQFLVGVPAAGRSHPELRNLVGVLMTPLPLRADLTGDPTFSSLLKRVRDVALDAYRHESVSLEQLVEELGVSLDPGRAPLFQVVFDLQDRIPLPETLGDLQLEMLELDPGVSMLDLSLYLAAEADGYRGFFEYNANLFSPDTIERYIDRLQVLLDGVLDDPDRPLSQLPLLGAAEQSMLASWNRTETPYPEQRCIHELFEEQVQRAPDATALIFRGVEMTYRELNAQADQLAVRLIAQGVEPEEFVALYIERSLEMVVGMLGILKAGAAYVPIDPSHPAARRELILEDSQVRIVLTQRRLRRGLAGDLQVWCLDAEWEQAADQTPSRGQIRCSPDQLAYMIHTSGSTGRPKGVTVTHRNVVNFFQGITNLDPDQAPGTLLAVTTISFDISVLELLWTLTRGFRVVIAPEQGLNQKQTPSIRSPRKAMQFSLFYFDCEETQQERGKYDLVLEGARFADQHDFTAVWTPERHFHPFGGVFPNPSVVMSAVAARTRHVGIRAGSVVLPLHDPLRVAEDWAVVDNISGGRVGIAFAPGSHPNDFVFAPEAYADRKEAMLREIETVRRLWRGESIRRIAGNREEVEVSIHPRPVQSELPVWMTAIGLESFQLAGGRGYNVLTHLLFHDTRDLTEKIVAYRQARRAAGYDGDGHVTLMVHTFVGESLRQVRDTVCQPLTGYLRSSADLFIKMGLASRFQVDVSQMDEDDVEAFVERAFDRFFDFNGLLGTPQECATMVETLRAIGVDEVACLIDFGVNFDAVMQGLAYLNDVRQRVNRPLLADLDAADNPVSLTDLMLRHEVTHLQCTPAMARMLLAESNAEEAFARLETLYVGGDTLPLDLATDLQRHVPGRIHNMYGPTETTVWSTAYTLKSRMDAVCIGMPLANTRVHVLDGSQRIVPIGTLGELYIGGVGVTPGYWQREDLTAQRFVPDRFSTSAGDRLYRTGDQVRWRRDGTLEFLGRLDHQVKIRGYRIELGEIESVLNQHEHVRQCAVLARTDVTGEKQLIAFVQPANGPLDSAALRHSLRGQLPDYMVPALWVGMDDFPLTANRKIDRLRLLADADPAMYTEPPPSTAADGEFRVSATIDRAKFAPVSSQPVPWRTNTERSLAQLWRGVLERDHVIGIHDNFFELGGHSLQATMLVTRIRQAFHVELSLREFFESKDLASLATLIDSKPPTSAGA